MPTASARTLLRKAAEAYGTPLYVYDERTIRERCRALRSAFPGASFHYAVKANANPALLSIIRSESIGIETVSAGELALAARAGFAKDAISFTCASITEEELSLAARRAGHVHLDSLYQLETWGKRKLGTDVSLRLNQGIGAGHHAHVITGGPDSKFGISLADLPKARRLARTYDLHITGLAQHIGSNVLSPAIFAKAMQKLLDTARVFPDVRHIDFGGGFGVPYREDERPLNLGRVGAEFMRRTEAFRRATGRDVRYAFEPGRFLVAEAGTLLTRVTDLKSTGAHSFAGVDSGFNHLIRPAMYGSYHAIENLSRSRGSRAQMTIAGNVCESGDLLAVKRKMLVPRIGDVLAIRNAGAYGMSMASRYNQRELPREALISADGSVREISGS